MNLIKDSLDGNTLSIVYKYECIYTLESYVIDVYHLWNFKIDTPQQQ